VKWPSVTLPGSTNNTPVIGTDFFPTFLAATGLQAPQGHAVDGENLTPLLSGNGGLKRDALYWHYPHYHPGGATPHGAIRQGDWRLVEFFEDNHVELYDLKNDLAETRDESKNQPDKAADLTQKLHAWRESVGAQMPTSNPDFDQEKDAAKKKGR